MATASRTTLKEARERFIYGVREWWYLTLYALLHDSPRPTVIGMGMLLVLFGITACFSPSMQEFEFFSLFVQVPAVIVGGFSVSAGLVLLLRGPRGNGVTWLGAMLGQFVWIWSLISVTIVGGVTISTVMYFSMTLCCWWIVFRT